MLPGNFEVSHVLTCVLEASEAPFVHATRTLKLLSSFSGFRRV